MSELTADEFLDRFFGAPNLVWPGMNPTDPVVQRLMPYLEALAYRGECPVILPRRRLKVLPSELYVISWDTAHAGRVRPLLEAAVAHHWVPFDGRVAKLDSADPIEKAVLDFIGPGTTFLLKPPSQEAATSLVRALRRLVDTLAGRPLRTPATARPVGRMLREFDLALASGATDSSASLLNEIQSFGGISHENVAFLRLRRLSRLGREAELLTEGSLPSLVYTEPPLLVREAILGAWARQHVLDALGSKGFEAALAVVKSAEPDIAMLVDERLVRTKDDDVAALCAIVALAREDLKLAAAFAGDRSLPPLVLARITRSPDVEPGPRTDDEPKYQGEFQSETEAGVQRGAESESQLESTAVPTSWLEWVTSLSKRPNQLSLDVDTVESWAPAWTVDRDLAAAIDILPELADDNLLSGVAAFLETDEPDHAAVHTAASLVTRYLYSERFDPADLAALCALLQIFVRGAPPAERYEAVLGDIRSYANQWVSVLNATRVIDIADAVACGPAPSAERESFVAALLAPLNQQRRRLAATLRGLAALVSGDLKLGLDWEVADESTEAVAIANAAAELEPRILLYSLDTGTLARAQAAIAKQWPKAQVETCADKVGSPGLKQHARNADVIVLATRRAAHAATGFISSNAGETSLICYADGSGSASMLRAAEAAIGEWSN